MITSGGSTTLEVTLNQASSTDTVVSLSSSSGNFSVPSSITIPAGETEGYATGVSSPNEPTEGATVSASANGLRAQCQVSVVWIQER